MTTTTTILRKGSCATSPIVQAFTAGLAMPRTLPAIAAAARILADGEWHRWTEVVGAMTDASDVVPVTASNRLHDLVAAGVLEREGRHPNRFLRLRAAEGRVAA